MLAAAAAAALARDLAVPSSALLASGAARYPWRFYQPGDPLEPGTAYLPLSLLGKPFY